MIQINDTMNKQMKLALVVLTILSATTMVAYAAPPEQPNVAALMQLITNVYNYLTNEIQDGLDSIQTELGSVTHMETDSGYFVAGPGGGTWATNYYGNIKHVSLTFTVDAYDSNGNGVSLQPGDTITLWSRLPMANMPEGTNDLGPIQIRVMTITADNWVPELTHVEFDTVDWSFEVSGGSARSYYIVGRWYATVTGI